MQDNKLIAEFMGLSHCSEGWITIPYHGREEVAEEEIVDELRYHTSWDWLMPVVQKCYDLEDEEMNNLGATADISMYLTDVDIQGVYSAVSEFIKQYTITQNQDDE